MKHFLSIFLLTFLGLHTQTTITFQSAKNFLASKYGAGTAATIGGYVLPALITGGYANSKAWVNAIPPFVGAGIACLLQQQGISAKWGCNTVTKTGNLLTLATYFGCAAIADALWHYQNPNPIETLGSATVTTLGVYAAFAGRDSILGK